MNQYSTKCNCERPLACIVCHNCGFRMGNCRARKLCPDHPNVLYLHDLSECPSCKQSVNYLNEYSPGSINQPTKYGFSSSSKSALKL